jgi:hypothetical protein
MGTDSLSQLPKAENNEDGYNTIVMKKIFRINTIILAAIILFLAGCLKKEDPESFSMPASNLSKTGATLNGTVNPGGLSTAVTFEYGTTTSYDRTITAIQSPVSGNNITNVSAEISGLTIGTTYHYRVKAENSHWTVYSSDTEFEYGYPPVVKTLVVKDLKSTGATLTGTVNPKGFSTKVTFEYGTTTSYGLEVTAEQNLFSGKSIKNASANISGLTIGTTYHFRVKAENSFGTVYGIDSEFEFGYPPSVTTSEVECLASNATRISGTVNARNLNTIVTFEYGTTTSYGSSVTASQSPVTGDSITNVSAEISGLTPCTIYHFRVKAQNSFGLSYGFDSAFYSPNTLSPALTTTSVSGITATTAISGGNITYGPCPVIVITERGVEYWPAIRGGASHKRTTYDGTGTGSYTSNLTGLDPSSVYMVRAYARYNEGTVYGNKISFKTSSSGK